MQKVMVGKAAIGKTLSENVYSNKGQLLMSTGTVLTESKVDLLKKYNILEVSVAD